MLASACDFASKRVACRRYQAACGLKTNPQPYSRGKYDRTLGHLPRADSRCLWFQGRGGALRRGPTQPGIQQRNVAMKLLRLLLALQITIIAAFAGSQAWAQAWSPVRDPGDQPGHVP